MSTSASTLTARDFFNLVLNATRDSDADDYQQMYTYASDAIAKLDSRNAKRRENSKPSKESLEAAARRDTVKAVIVANPTVVYDRSTLAELTGLTTGQVTAAMTALIREGVAVKFPAKGKVPTQYKLA